VRFDLVAGDDLGVVGNAIAMPVEEHDIGGFGVPAVAGRVVPPTPDCAGSTDRHCPAH
jgi:hypothetical protein